MDDSLAQQAINAALKGNWNKAKELNLLILKDQKDDIDALNRLARAYYELNDVKNAKSSANKVLKIDPFNSIATKSLSRWSSSSSTKSSDSGAVTANSFLEEPGKTKTVNLIHIGDKTTIAGLDMGDVVHMNTRAHRICITNSEGDHIGKLPDDVSNQIRKLMKIGYEYSALVKSIDSTGVKIFIKETKRPSQYSQIPSFISEKFNYVSYTPPELVHDKPKVSFSDDDEDDGEGISHQSSD